MSQYLPKDIVSSIEHISEYAKTVPIFIYIADSVFHINPNIKFAMKTFQLTKGPYCVPYDINPVIIQTFLKNILFSGSPLLGSGTAIKILYS